MKRRSFEEMNFPQSAQQKFDALMADESWTWTGLAHAFRKRFKPVDIEELLSGLKEGN